MGDCDWEKLGRIARRIKWQFHTENLSKCLTSHRIAIVNDVYFECSLCDKKDRFSFFEIHLRSTLHRSRYERRIDDEYRRSQGFVKGTTKNKYFCKTCDDILVDENLNGHIESDLHKRAAIVKEHADLLQNVVNENTKTENVKNGDDENDSAKIGQSINQDAKYDEKDAIDESVKDEQINSDKKELNGVAKVGGCKLLEVSSEDAKDVNVTNEANKSENIKENGTEPDEDKNSIVKYLNEEANKEVAQDKEPKAEDKTENVAEVHETVKVVGFGAKISNEGDKKEVLEGEEPKFDDIKTNGIKLDETEEGFKTKMSDDHSKKEVSQGEEPKSESIQDNGTDIDETAKVGESEVENLNGDAKKEPSDEEPESENIKENGIELDETAEIGESKPHLNEDAKKEAGQNEELKSENIKENGIELDETAEVGESKAHLNEDAKKEAGQDEELKSENIKENGIELDKTAEVGESKAHVLNENAKKEAGQDEELKSEIVKENVSRPDGGPFGELGYLHHLPRVYFDLTSDGAPLGRLIFELRSDVAPKTCENFRCLCTGEKGFGFKGTQIDRVTSAFVSGGDVEKGDGTGGRSIYGKTFAHENYTLKHSSGGVLSMRSASDADATSDSRFRLSTKPLPDYNGRRVAFGSLVDGAKVLKRITKVRTFHGIPFKKILIQHCGQFYY